MADDAPQTRVYAPIGTDPAYRFASAGTVLKPGKMVYLDFVQADPNSGSEPVVRAIARIVMHPDAAAQLAEQLRAIADADE